MGGHTLWTRDRDSWWALGVRARHNGGDHPSIGSSWTAYGRRVTVAAPNLPWGHSVARPATRSHLTDRVYLVWRRGQLMGAQARWRCGSLMTEFQLTDEPTHPTCVACALKALKLPSTVSRIDIGLTLAPVRQRRLDAQAITAAVTAEVLTVLNGEAP